jgi:hypothetical protein
MKNGFLVLAALFIYLGAFSQEIDSRLVRNRGKQAEEAFKHNKNGYNYFLYELDSSYTVKEISELNTDEKKLISKDIQISEKEAQVIGTNQFNFYALGIKLNNQSRQYFKIDTNRVLVFYKISEITEAFFKSPLNTK